MTNKHKTNSGNLEPDELIRSMRAISREAGYMSAALSGMVNSINNLNTKAKSFNKIFKT